ncbi:MAG TPA: EthD domain-containing protein [Alphaproteobacteria bacterium]|nr:EthD domain-containing protein [Alphaproteobacteria bacterium]
MFKAVALITRRPDMSREQFLEYYANNHVKLVWRVFPWTADYRRNFIDLSQSILAPGIATPDFDSITEMWFHDRSGYDRMLNAHAEPGLDQTMKADEGRFMDRTKTRFFIADEYGATDAGSAENAPGFKVMALLGKKPGLSKGEFVDYYENHHVPLIRGMFDGIVEYRRSYIDLDGAIMADGVAAPDFDVVTELWFKDRSGYEAMLKGPDDPAVSKRVADDEEHFLDRSKTRFFVVDEHTEH